MHKELNKYTYRVTWSERDNEFIALCAEFPSLSWLAAKPDIALKGIRKVVNSVLNDMKRGGEKIPEPLSTHKFSGKFVVRILPEEHRSLAIEAAESGVSLNRLVNAKLHHA